MSLSNPKVSISSPVKRYYTFQGSEGQLVYWNKDEQKKITQQLPFEFITIDQLSCVEGYSQKNNKGFRSNEVRSTQNEELDVKWNGGMTIIKGLYTNIKDDIEKLGGNYYKSIYGVQLIDGEYQIINIKFKGSALSSWLSFDKSVRGGVDGLKITITKSELKKTGRVEFYEPVFTGTNIAGTKPFEAAYELDTNLQEYLTNKSQVKDFISQELTNDEKSQLVKPHKNNNNDVFMSADDIFEDFE